MYFIFNFNGPAWLFLFFPSLALFYESKKKIEKKNVSYGSNPFFQSYFVPLSLRLKKNRKENGKIILFILSIVSLNCDHSDDFVMFRRIYCGVIARRMIFDSDIILNMKIVGWERPWFCLFSLLESESLISKSEVRILKKKKKNTKWPN